MNLFKNVLFQLCWVFVAVLRLLIAVASLVVEGVRASGVAWAQLPHGTWDLNSLTRDQSHVPCIARRILSHWTTREILNKSFLKSQNLFLFLATREC